MAQLDFIGIVFPWPIMFIIEENVDSLVLEEKYEKIKEAKRLNKELELGIDFEKYGI